MSQYHRNDILFYQNWYKDVDGIKMSHSWIEKHQSHTETFLSNVIINADIDPKLFDPKANDIVARGHRALPYSIRDSDFANSLVRGVSNPYGQRKTSESEEIPGTKVF